MALPFAVCLNSGTRSVSLSDNTRKLKSINFKRAAALLATGERNVTRVMMEFLRSTVPVFEEFLTVLQTSGPTVHVVHDAMHLTLLKLMR